MSFPSTIIILIEMQDIQDSSSSVGNNRARSAVTRNYSGVVLYGLTLVRFENNKNVHSMTCTFGTTGSHPGATFRFTYYLKRSSASPNKTIHVRVAGLRLHNHAQSLPLLSAQRSIVHLLYTTTQSNVVSAAYDNTTASCASLKNRLLSAVQLFDRSIGGGRLKN